MTAAPDATNIYVNGDGFVNFNSYTYVVYLFTYIPGFSQFGSYTGNGSSDGPFIWTGFKPSYILIKRKDSSGDWYLWDTARDTYNVVAHELFTDLSNAEASFSDIDANANGFKVRNTTADFNTSGGTYIFAAFAKVPFKYANAR